jgi:ParB family chromosome partitioning protein
MGADFMADEATRKRLGRGLAALIGELDQPVAQRSSAAAKSDRKVAIELVRANPHNPRRHFAESELHDLAASIARHGVVQPILVRPLAEKSADGARFEIIAGERRWRASQKAGLHEVPVIIRDVGDQQALELAIIENVQRADLNAIEEATGYQSLIDEYKYSQADLAQVVGKSRSHVANTLRLLKLPADVQKAVSRGDLSAGHARALITAGDPVALAQRIVRDGLSVRQAEALAQPKSAREGAKKKAAAAKDADTRAMEKRLEEALGLKVAIHAGDNGTGDIRIRYLTEEQRDALCQLLEGGI